MVKAAHTAPGWREVPVPPLRRLPWPVVAR
ncbi:MAG TPA: AraC family transcriptional regulator, partial [Stenotrophomonas sp.]|nr:AraC family transcriptional regulator [Stenotrophomonas sp.]